MSITRFAPSPTGYLHLGHAYSALFARAHAGERGRFLLRIEDIDPGRRRPEFIDGIYEDLAWLGLDWETPVRMQSAHMDDYASALDALKQAGLLYPCFCTRKEIAGEVARIGNAPHGPDGLLYPGTCRPLHPDERAEKLAAGLPHAWRLDVTAALKRVGILTWRDLDRGEQIADPAQFGDVVLARKDSPTSYHLAVTVDDALQGISLVTRGEDLRAATHVHRLLQALLDLPVPDYVHHKLLTDSTGKRLAKRDKAATLRDMRRTGKTPESIRAELGFG